MTTLLEFDAIGTSWSIQVETGSENQLQKLKATLQKEIESVVTNYDKLYSRFRNDSLVAEIRHFTNSGDEILNKKSWNFPSHAHDLFSFYSKMEEITGGLFTPSVGHSLEEIGYDAAYNLGIKPHTNKQNSKQQSSVQFSDLLISKQDDSVVLTVPFSQLSTNTPLMLDFGAAGKGQLVDLISKLLAKHNSKPTSYIVNGSGDIIHHGTSQITVGLENPYAVDSVIGAVKIQNQALCGSAPNRRTWQVSRADSTLQQNTSQTTYHHILNPQTLKSPTHIAATWVIAQTALEADGIATGLFLAPAQTLQATFDFEYLILYTTGSIEKSSCFSAEMYV
jgi:FAD:protein FMN transferase